jgi:hypothetical protein
MQKSHLGMYLAYPDRSAQNIIGNLYAFRLNITKKWHIVTYMTPTSTIRTQKASPQPTLTHPDERVRERLTPRTRTPTFQHCFFPSLARLAYPLQALLRLRLCPNSKKSANKHLPIPPNIHRTGVSTTCGVSCLSVQPRKSRLSTAGQMERYTRVAPR